MTEDIKKQMYVEFKVEREKWKIVSFYFNDLQEMYNKILTDDGRDISIEKVVNHINAVEAGRGSNTWASLKYQVC